MLGDNTVVYDKTNDEFKGKNGPDELDVDVSDIVILGENNEKKDVVSILINEKVDVSGLLLDEIKRTRFNNREVLMYSVAIKNSSNFIIVYKLENLYKIAELNHVLDSKLDYYNLLSLNGELIYSMTVNQEYRIADIEVNSQNSGMEKFSKLVLQKQNSYFASDRNNDLEVKSRCCRNHDGWGDCITCSINSCSRSWLCGLSAMVLGKEMAAGFAVSCIGAGDGAWC